MKTQSTMQKTLSPAQIEAFYSDTHTNDQVEHFAMLTSGRLAGSRRVVDIGGGCGFFASRIGQRTGLPVRVIDTDPASIETCKNVNPAVDAVLGDALAPITDGTEGIVCFNLILHHLVAESETQTRDLQMRALRAWHGRADYLFVNEYVYEAPGGSDFAGRMIFEVTSSKGLSAMARLISRPRALRFLRANTFGVGVRFRSDASWRKLFAECGYRVAAFAPGPDEPMPAVRRAVGIQSKRRNSYLLQPLG